MVQPVFDFCLHARVFLKDNGDCPDKVTSEENDIAILRIWQCDDEMRDKRCDVRYGNMKEPIREEEIKKL